MRITGADGRTLGHARIEPADVGAMLDSLEDRARRRVDDVRRAPLAIEQGPGGGLGYVEQGPAPRYYGPGPRRGRFWPWAALVMFTLGVVIAIGSQPDPAAPSSEPAPGPGSSRTALAPADVSRATVLDNGEVLVGSTVVDNLYTETSPLRARFTAVLAAGGASGTVGHSLDTNIRSAISFCHAYADGDVVATRQATDVRNGTGDAYGTGKQQRAVVAGALSAVCPAL